MSKYLLLLILNIPFVVFGFTRALMMYRTHKLSQLSFALRVAFWLIILSGLAFAKDLYTYLVVHKLTDSTPLSIADVVLTTGVIFCLFLCTRLYAKLDNAEQRLSELHEKISIITSQKP